MEALKARAQVPAAKGSWDFLILLKVPEMMHSWLILLAFLAFQSAKPTGFFWMLQVEAGLTLGTSNFVDKLARFRTI